MGQHRVLPVSVLINARQWFTAAMVILTFTACQVKPTKVSSSRVRPENELIVSKAHAPLALNEMTVVVDVRANFDFGLNHILNSYNLPWQNLAEKESTGELLRDNRTAALRLSLLGLTPQTSVVVVGNGQGGQGEEGRVAWQLLYLGFKDVQTASVETFRAQMTQNSSPPAQNVPLWKANPHEDLKLEKSEFLALARNPKRRMETKTVILDVRSEKEYLHSKHPDFQALNIEWKQFFTPNGRPNPKLKERMMALGILPSHRIVVVSGKGVRSSAASYALIALGYERVQNFIGGYSSL
jgi:thiosulfate/3-mercaptopyruvate sulfurtransferase